MGGKGEHQLHTVPITNTVGTRVYSNLKYCRFMFQLSQNFHIFSKPVNTLKIKNNLLWIMDGIFCGLSEIFHSVDQSSASNHNILCWNILLLSQYI